MDVRDRGGQMFRIGPVTDGAQLRQAFGCFPSGVTAVCALVDGTPVGLAASSFTSVSLSPPLVSVCVQLTSTTWPVLRERPRLGLSVLAEDHDDACLRLASKERDRFAGTEWVTSKDGAVFVHGSTAWLDCSVHQEVPAGDHVIVLLRVEGVQAEPATPPLVFHNSRLRRLSAA
jgi:flavin reductase (DIM6/NTAB) family NADH-FMN oxidoreductase RutF